MGKEVGCPLFRGRCVFGQRVLRRWQNWKLDCRGKNFWKCKCDTNTSKDGVGATADAYHPSHIGQNEAKASDNLTAQVSSLGTRLKEMTLANDWRLTSLETHIDGF